MHYPFWYFPFARPLKKLKWNEVDSVSPATVFFLPGILTLQFRLPVFRLTAGNGASVLVFRPEVKGSGEQLRKLMESRTD